MTRNNAHLCASVSVGINLMNVHLCHLKISSLT